MSDIVKQLMTPPFGTETSERLLMERAASEIKKLRETVEYYGDKDTKNAKDISNLVSKSETLRVENEKLRAALKLMIDTQDDWEQSVAKIIGKQPSVFNRAIDAAKAALGESDE